jgi:hypothetical protein
MTIAARGRMYESTALGTKTMGSARAIAAGRKPPRRSSSGLIATSAKGIPPVELFGILRSRYGPVPHNRFEEVLAPPKAVVVQEEDLVSL